MSSSNATNASQDISSDTITIDRRTDERRSGDVDAIDTGAMEAPRRKKQRRRHIDPTTCERDYSEQEIEFMRAMDDYKQSSGRMFPTCSEVLEVLRDLGYVQLDDDQFDQLGLNVSNEAEAEADHKKAEMSSDDDFDNEENEF